MRKLTVYTDGACSGNPGVGGWGAIVIDGDRRIVIRGRSVKTTTNNRMELTPVDKVLEWVNKNINEPCEIDFNTDSMYLIVCTNPKLKDGSKKTGSWFRGRPNEDLWFGVISKGNKGKHKLTFHKVKGHSGDMYNEHCDKIAKEECARARHELYRNGR